jgi:cation transport ATPase
MVFDKTGTLTEDGLQILGVRALKGEIDKPDAMFEKF